MLIYQKEECKLYSEKMSSSGSALVLLTIKALCRIIQFSLSYTKTYLHSYVYSKYTYLNLYQYQQCLQNFFSDYSFIHTCMYVKIFSLYISFCLLSFLVFKSFFLQTFVYVCIYFSICIVCVCFHIPICLFLLLHSKVVCKQLECL